MFVVSILFVIICIGTLFVSIIVPLNEREHRGEIYSNKSMKKSFKYAAIVSGGLSVVAFLIAMVITVPAGHSAVGTLFGKVYKEAKFEGIHLVNPLSSWTQFDCRQKAIDQQSKVPSMDQLQTTLDATVKFRIIKGMTPEIYGETGDVDSAIRTHLIPQFRSLLREQGKTVAQAEDFYKEEVQQRLQNTLRDELAKKMMPKGMEIQDVLIRNISLPVEIDMGVKDKKKRDQMAEKQKSELRRFETEQQQKVKQAEAERQAAEEQAKQIRVLADAKAYEIKKINEAIAKNPAYIKLEALKALEAISKDKTAKIYFLNGDSPQPLPLMNIGDAYK